MLAAAVLVVVLAFLLQVRPDGRVAFRGLADYPLPHSCPSYAWFGVKCPGCGLTRGMIYLALGDLSAAQAMHPLSLLMAAVILVQIPYRLACLARGGRSPLGTVVPEYCGHALIVALIGTWLCSLVQ